MSDGVVRVEEGPTGYSWWGGGSFSRKGEPRKSWTDEGKARGVPGWEACLSGGSRQH